MRLFGYLLALWLPLFAMAPLQVKTVQSGYLTLTDDSTRNTEITSLPLKIWVVSPYKLSIIL